MTAMGEQENDRRYEPGWREGIWVARPQTLERYHACPYCRAALLSHDVTESGETYGDEFVCGTVVFQSPPNRSDNLSAECKRRTRMFVALKGGSHDPL